LETTDGQVRKLMKEMRKHGKVGQAADRSAMDRKTARKYVRAGRLLSELKQPRSWRTRKSPISVEDWAFVEAQLRDAPKLEAKTLFEVLQEAHPGTYGEGQLRTLQRHVKQWRTTKGPDKEVFFSQQHRPGKAAQTDFTHTKELGVTIVGVAFVVHMLCHFVPPYSNWESVTVCLSESLLSLRRSVQDAMFRLGHHPEWHQTDNSTAATHTGWKQ